MLEQIELQIGEVKEQAFGRKDILEKVEKWLSACDEESWLEEYNRVSCFLPSYIFRNLPQVLVLNTRYKHGMVLVQFLV